MITSCTVVLFTRAFTLIAMNTTLIPFVLCAMSQIEAVGYCFMIVDCIENSPQWTCGVHGGLMGRPGRESFPAAI